MSIIGTFKRTGSDYTGEIHTLNVQQKDVRIVTEETGSEDAPSHRVFVGRAEIGAAWTKTSRENRNYLSIKLDDPSFSQPIFASLLEVDAGDYALIWSRSRSTAA